VEKRGAREAIESVCEELAREISCPNSEICRMMIEEGNKGGEKYAENG
jgi:hypothetical protein